jgi:hypothetical protein
LPIEITDPRIRSLRHGLDLGLNGNPVEVTTEVDVDFTIPTAAARR